MEKLGLSRQVTYHLIHTMHGTGIIRKNDRNRYVLGLAAVSIAEGFSRQLAPPEHLARRVRAIVAATGETAYAGGWVDGEIVALATARGESPVGAAQVPQGYSGHAHARAAGKLLLAMVEPAVREAYLAKHSLEARTSKTITDREELLREFETNSDSTATPSTMKNFTRDCSVLPFQSKAWGAGLCWGSRFPRDASTRISKSIWRPC